MSATASVTTPWYQRPDPLPFDFIGTKKFVEKLKVIEKTEGVSLPCTPMMGGGASIGYALPAYFIFVMTPFGDMRLDVSKAFFDLIEVGDPLIVSYRHGRWTGALKGKITR
jgi:hypothetical protein